MYTQTKRNTCTTFPYFSKEKEEACDAAIIGDGYAQAAVHLRCNVCLQLTRFDAALLTAALSLLFATRHVAHDVTAGALLLLRARRVAVVLRGIARVVDEQQPAGQELLHVGLRESEECAVGVGHAQQALCQRATV